MADVVKFQPEGQDFFDVFEGSRKLGLPEFQQRGLNIEHIPQVSAAPIAQAAPQPVAPTVNIPDVFSAQDIINPASAAERSAAEVTLQQRQQEFLQTFAETEKETALQSEIADFESQLADLRQREQKGLFNIEQQRIAMPLVTGQQAALQRQAQLERGDILAQLEAKQRSYGFEVKKREGLMAKAKAKLGFAESDLDRITKIEQRNEDMQFKILEFAQGLRVEARQTLGLILKQMEGLRLEELSPQGQQEIAQAAEQVGLPLEAVTMGMDVQADQKQLELHKASLDIANKQFNLQEAARLAPLEEEYKRAQISNIRSQVEARGVVPGVDIEFVADILAEPSLFNSLTPSKKSELLPTLTKFGFKPVRNLTERVANGFADMDNVRGIIDRVDTLLRSGVSTGPLSATAGLFQRTIGIESPQQQSFVDLTEDLFRTVLKATSGVAASEREVTRLKSFLPKFRAQETTNKQNVIDFRQTLHEAEYNAIKRFADQGFDVSNQLRTLDARLLSELAGIDLSGLALREGEAAAVNRKTGNVEAITKKEHEAEPTKYLLLQ